jgi:hypothetical protein
MEYDNTDKGTLFVNDKKETEKHPDYNGSINVGGKDFWISGWKKKSEKTGKTFLSLSVRAKEETPRQSSEPTRKATKGAGGFADMDDDMPFADPMKSRAYALSI